ncbi:MAG TPA: hypothetical protein VFF52_13130 [Isosphaeraceae bacterium]|nr:hypothetical protein [Isosphaeraceae bacterium]
MKRLVLGLLVSLFSIQTIGCDSGGGGGGGTTGAPAPAAPAAPVAGSPAKGKGGVNIPKASVLANPDGPKNDR